MIMSVVNVVVIKCVAARGAQQTNRFEFFQKHAQFRSKLNGVVYALFLTKTTVPLESSFTDESNHIKYLVVGSD